MKAMVGALVLAALSATSTQAVRTASAMETRWMAAAAGGLWGWGGLPRPDGQR